MKNEVSAPRLVVVMAALFVTAHGLFPTNVTGQDKVYALSELSELPRLADMQQATRAITDAYPRQLQRNRVGGKVQIKFVVNVDGRVDGSSIEVMAAAVEELGEAAREAVALLEFVPGKIDGNPVRVAVVFPITFGASE
jgi:periplasmic protein TonB